MTTDRSMSDMREQLAALEHEQWAHWTRHMLMTIENELVDFGQNEEDEREAQTSLRVLRSLVCTQRWRRQSGTPYEFLSPREKDSDREWAVKVLEILRKRSPLEEANHTPPTAPLRVAPSVLPSD